MKHSFKDVLVSFLVSLIPAVVVALITLVIHPIIALVLSLCVLWFGMDCCLNGSDRKL